MKEFEIKRHVKINFIPTTKMVEDAHERVTRASALTQEHILESQLALEAPVEKKLAK